MDSITQATLGAAVGEAVLGKKMGNKAILLGAIAGTIPDLDVLSRLFLDHEVYGLVYHRGITHSIFFTIVTPPLFAWLTLKYYERGLHKKLGVQVAMAVWWGIFYLAIMMGLGALLFYTQNIIAGSVFLAGGLLGIPIYKTLRESIVGREEIEYDVSLMQMTLMYMLAFLTHWLIDACTAYGTQIFEPFSRYRVAFNNIAIVDPLYTVPMIIGLVGAMYTTRIKDRRLWNTGGLVLSTLYMAYTFVAKANATQVFQQNMQAEGIEAVDYITYPTIFNTILWQTTIVTEDAYYYGLYSLLDKEPKVKFIKLPKNHELIDKYKDHEYMKILLWFANGYYNITERDDGTLMFNNLRFGMVGLPDSHPLPLEERYIFRFILTEKEGKFDVEGNRGVQQINPAEPFRFLWKRMWGV